MRSPMLDPTAGKRAREIREHPGAPQRITDPTDPRYGELVPDTREQALDAQRVLDPTRPEYGTQPDSARPSAKTSDVGERDRPGLDLD